MQSEDDSPLKYKRLANLNITGFKLLPDPLAQMQISNEKSYRLINKVDKSRNIKL